MKPLEELLGSIKVSAEGTTATLTGKLPPDLLNAVMGQLPFLEMLAPREVAQPMPGQDTPLPAPAPDFR